MSIQTVLTRRLGIRHPILVAPLGRGSTPEFLGAISRAGALGFVALGHIPEAIMQRTLADYIAATGGGHRFGVNLVLIIDQMRRLDIALDAGCRIVSVLRGDPAPYVHRARRSGAIVFWTVSGPEEAKRAAGEGADFILAQGREAGGHLTGEAPLMTLLPAVIDAAQGVPVVAAGGIAEGRGVAAAFTLGACGAWMGTRFIATHESGCHQGHKIKIVQSKHSDLIETTLFDGGWSDSPHRVLVNSTIRNWQAAGSPPTGIRPGEGDVIGRTPEGLPILRYNVSSPWDTMDGNWEVGPLYAGLSVELINRIESVSELIPRIVSDAEAALSCANSYVMLHDGADPDSLFCR